MSGGSRGRRGPGRIVLVGVGLFVVALIVARIFLVQPFSIPSASMEPLLRPGEVVLAWKPGARELRRGDVVIFDGRSAFGADGSGSPYFAKRIIGVAGDRVTCCGENGKIRVDGRPLDETYVFAGDAPSEDDFDIEVPRGRIFLLGDHRSKSADSRSHLGDPGGGMVSTDDVVGTVSYVVWPLGAVGTPAAIPGPSSRP